MKVHKMPLWCKIRKRLQLTQSPSALLRCYAGVRKSKVCDCRTCEKNIGLSISVMAAQICKSLNEGIEKGIQAGKEKNNGRCKVDQDNNKYV